MESQPWQCSARDFCVPHEQWGTPLKGWNLEEVILAAAKQFNINPSSGPVTVEAQGILPQTSPEGRNTPLKVESKVLHGALLVSCPISSQTHLLLFSKPVSGKKCKVAGVTAQLRGDCKGSLRKGGAPSPTPQKGQGDTWE